MNKIMKGVYQKPLNLNFFYGNASSNNTGIK